MATNQIDESEKEFCFLCGSHSIAVSRNRRSINFVRLHWYYKCRVCKAYSLFPKIKDEEIQDLYSKKYIEDVNPDFDVKEQVTESRFSKLLSELNRVENPTDQSFLDYGCGVTAEMVTLASTLGFTAYGVEVEEGTRQDAEQKSGCKIFSPQTLLASGICFDIIFLGDVLEHLCDPLVALKQVGALLAPDGHLILQGPLEGAGTISNALLSVKAQLLSKSSSQFPPYHVSLATRDSIVRALKINGFVIQKLTITEPLWPAPRFGSRDSIKSLPALIFSFVKIVDIFISKLLPNFGTRFFLIAVKE
jgi:2-polyprenyl-3-methyl-5-hydroxy-6-metoxy-1,4-benzoquinol methylase